MLTLFRNLVRSKVALVLIALLILSLAAFGITDIFSPGLGNGLARVGDRTIEASEIDRAMDAQLDRINQQNNANFTRAQFADSGQLVQTISTEISRQTVVEFLNQSGMEPSAQSIQDRIRNIPIFRSQINGSFDVNNYNRFLQNSRVTEAEFVRSIEEELALTTLSRGFSGAIDPPKSIADLTMLYRSENRRIAYMTVTLDNLTEEISETTEEELRDFYTEQQGNLLQPERRAFSIVAVNASDFIHKVEVTDEELENEYQAQLSRFSAPSTRTYDLLAFPSESSARQAIGELLADEPPAEVAAKYSGQPLPTEIKKQNEITPPSLGEEVYSAPVGLWSGPVSLNGTQWALINVREEEPGDVQPLEEVQDILRSELQVFKAEQAYLDSFDMIDDTLGSGLPLEEISELLESPIYTFPPIDPNGFTEDGLEVGALTGIDGAVSYGFDLYPDETSFRQDAGDTQFIIRLDEVVDGYIPEFEDVKDDLSIVLERRKQSEALGELADGITSRLSDGGFLTAEAEKLGLDVLRPQQALTRNSPQQTGFSRNAIEQIFAVGLDDHFAIPTNTGLRIGVVEAIDFPDSNTLDALSQSAKSELTPTFVSELENGLFSVARDTVKTTTNDQAIQDYIDQNMSPE
ncbi:MAG: hypothetical protein CMK09_13370 [Ponticaulis sp.]|nr:hypothetical protein [Ponticaulis sp.]|tara:strand:+ start:32694 stop:34595 length:1902 start_codon:yes stop_codon:yes gene_type:complete